MWVMLGKVGDNAGVTEGDAETFEDKTGMAVDGVPHAALNTAMTLKVIVMTDLRPNRNPSLISPRCP